MTVILILIAAIATLAGTGALVVRQIADARRQQYQDEVLASDLGYLREVERTKKRFRHAAHKTRKLAARRTRIHQTKAAHSTAAYFAN
ncbi:MULTISPECIES: hypothetical protein [Rhizobium/Agrobacterium group]|uniref:Uncharacterized protein n=1 Tax=Rhizobium soli TaxID=424798 RepID=A0A7X0JJ44_9HYPH|nr:MULTISPECIES: hypothetical protein [Rhizobium/Agrobacterium group]MBB6508155.1 hypothetical protein [Rhizobium soli]MBD8652246.1 hypothetical protein [Rhizobium sp. CFBP 13726]MBD8665169.1 hypothetical protein [Rhizobium sp. CFBP 8752]NSY15776.1 hypothetical protein [Neorhizobium sp. AL 9.2.2]